MATHPAAAAKSVAFLMAQPVELITLTAGVSARARGWCWYSAFNMQDLMLIVLSGMTPGIAFALE